MTRRTKPEQPATEPTPPVYDGDLVVLYPTRTAMVPGIPVDIVVCTPEDAAELLAYHPPIFTTDEPAGDTAG